MIVILAGGSSAEREVSFATAKSIGDSLKHQDIRFTQIDPQDIDWLQQTKEVKPTVVVIALHGPFGEDGTVQKILEDNNISYTGSNPDTASITINKIKTKSIVSEKYNLKVAKDFNDDSIIYPAVVKPNKQGSSFGVSIVNNQLELAPAIELAKKYDEDGEILIEEQIQGIELTCGVIDIFGKTQALPLVEIVPNGQFFDFQAKYDTESGCQEICPAQIGSNSTKMIQESSIRLFKRFGIKQYCRIDWILRDDEPYFLEVNTLPGMTPTSLINKELVAAHIKYDDFIKKLLETADNRYN